jgi:hypothetical protein
MTRGRSAASVSAGKNQKKMLDCCNVDLGGIGRPLGGWGMAINPVKLSMPTAADSLRFVTLESLLASENWPSWMRLDSMRGSPTASFMWKGSFGKSNKSTTSYLVQYCCTNRPGIQSRKLPSLCLSCRWMFAKKDVIGGPAGALWFKNAFRCWSRAFPYFCPLKSTKVH